MNSPKRVVLTGAGTAVVVALLFGYDTSTSGPAATTPQSAIVSGGATSAGSSPPAPASSAPRGQHTAAAKAAAKSSAKPAPKPATTTATGAVAQTQWGPVQVRLTASGGRLTKVDVLQYPQGNGNDAQINGYALPILIQETIRSQSSHIDMVSGATVTSTGYLQSLQSALDQLQA